MNEDLKSIDERLDGLRLATEAIQPSPDFQVRVMAAIVQRGNPDWRLSLLRIGRYGLLASFVAVALTTLLAAKGAAKADELQAMTYGTVELEW